MHGGIQKGDPAPTVQENIFLVTLAINSAATLRTGNVLLPRIQQGDCHLTMEAPPLGKFPRTPPAAPPVPDTAGGNSAILHDDCDSEAIQLPGGQLHALQKSSATCRPTAPLTAPLRHIGTARQVNERHPSSQPQKSTQRDKHCKIFKIITAARRG